MDIFRLYGPVRRQLPEHAFCKVSKKYLFIEKVGNFFQKQKKTGYLEIFPSEFSYDSTTFVLFAQNMLTNCKFTVKLTAMEILGQGFCDEIKLCSPMPRELGF